MACLQWLGGVEESEESKVPGGENSRDKSSPTSSEPKWNAFHNHLEQTDFGPSPGENKLCDYCDDGTLDKDCGDCHNSYERCGHPEVDNLDFRCYDCESNDTPYAGRKLFPGEKSWAEKQKESSERIRT